MSDSVLVIDNDPNIVELLSYFFERRGYTVHTAMDGTEGLRQAIAHRPDVVICDVIMEPVHGFQVLEDIRARRELDDTVVIMVSAKSFRPDIERALQLGADDYVVKPFLMDELLLTVQQRCVARHKGTMTVRFWGTRGSIATPGPATTRYGGNTSCVELRCGGEVLVFDAGTGIRALGESLLREFKGRPLTVHLFVSHTHWDHIQGFPFFTPAYQVTSTINVYGPSGQGRPLEKLLRGQMDPDYFPVALGDMGAAIRVHEYRTGEFAIGDTTVRAHYLNHPGMTLGYRVTHGGRSVVYATDNEPYRHTLPRFSRRAETAEGFGALLDENLVRFVADADLYIGEAQYTDEEYPRKVGWGHSSVSATVEVALQARVKTLALYHHDPMHTDDVVTAMEATARRIIESRGAAMRCFAAQEGQVIEV
ncbi:MAG TPA: response regulator [Methylomirabilota bacterium]|nr:response regulator [Methylomirabilota bacterium]